MTFALSTHAAETLTAWSTALLSATTFILAIATVALVRRTREGIREEQASARQDLEATREATRSAQAVAQRQIEATYQPVLVDVLPLGQTYSSMGARPGTSDRELSTVLIDVSHRDHVEAIDPRRVWVHPSGDELLLSVPLRNVGQGLAVVDELRTTLRGKNLFEVKPQPAKPTRVPAGESTRINATCRVNPAQLILMMIDGANWTLEVPYTDFIGGQRMVASVRIRSKPGSNYEPYAWFVADVQQNVPASPSAVETSTELSADEAGHTAPPRQGTQWPDQSTWHRYLERRRARRQASLSPSDAEV